MADGKNMIWVNWLMCLLALTGVVLAALIYSKVNKKCSSQGYLPPNKASRRSKTIVKDMGPSAGRDRVSNPPNDFVSGCQTAFSTGCASSGGTVNVCGGLDSNNNMVINCQDYTNMDDQSCYNSSFVAYQPSDCTNPYQWTQGYLCGGGSGDPGSNPCAEANNVIGPAPPNLYGCTNICN